MIKRIEVCTHCGTEISSTFNCTGCGSSTGEFETIVINMQPEFDCSIWLCEQVGGDCLYCPAKI